LRSHSRPGITRAHSRRRPFGAEVSTKKNLQALILLTAALVLSYPLGGAVKKRHAAAETRGEITGGEVNRLWSEPEDISSRNLFYGPGGKGHEPQGSFTFVKEDLDGSNPKFVVRDADGVEWKVKLGVEAKPETVASRLVWAIGYHANEDYFLADFRAEGMPAHLKRRHADKFIEPDGAMRDVRLKRYLEGEKKIGEWKWRDGPFAGTRELNALRVMMALINNWDLKDENNSVYGEKSPGREGEQVYMVSDLGASFGSWGLGWNREESKGNLDSYTRSKFIKHIGAGYVDFEVPHRPTLIVLVNPHEFFSRLTLRWIGRHIPREDARWAGQLLARLSPAQVSDAFRAAGYSPQEVAGFTAVVESRIAELNKL
jgi:hypothetical protein